MGSFHSFHLFLGYGRRNDLGVRHTAIPSVFNTSFIHERMLTLYSIHHVPAH